tara:strand:- start:442 stop:882 length:441 start_codon:yes stop_codon:yes gene_type:complete
MLKKQLQIFRNFLLLLIFVLIVSTKAYADVLKPNKNISPKEVVKIQLNALMKNDSPYKDRGILQTWEFAHPNNQRYTGPIERFKIMLKGKSFSMMLNHKENKVVEVLKMMKLLHTKLPFWVQIKIILNSSGRLKKIKLMVPQKIAG